MAIVGKSRRWLGHGGEGLEMRLPCPYHWQAASMPNGYY